MKISDVQKNRVLITGESGFVGPYLRSELEKNGYIVYGLGLKHYDKEGYFVCDITNRQRIFEIVNKIRPDFIYHLAGFSSVSESLKKPELCTYINVTGTKNLLDAVLDACINPKILIISSADIYGLVQYLPVDENHPTNPISPYGKSRLFQEQLTKDYHLQIIIVRSFNHTGPDQPTNFVIPSFVNQVAESKENSNIKVGNISVVRDFSDVKDVVRAYRIILEKGTIGEVYNVGSGYGYKLEDILTNIISKSGKHLKIVIDPTRYREADITTLICNTEKTYKIIGFRFKKIF